MDSDPSLHSIRDSIPNSGPNPVPNSGPNPIPNPIRNVLSEQALPTVERRCRSETDRAELCFGLSIE